MQDAWRDDKILTYKTLIVNSRVKAFYNGVHINHTQEFISYFTKSKFRVQS